MRDYYLEALNYQDKPLSVLIHKTIRIAIIYADNLEVLKLTAVMEATRSSADERSHRRYKTLASIADSCKEDF